MKANYYQNDAPFNMAMLFYIELHNLRMEKIKAAITNDVRLYYDCLEEIFTNIFFILKNDDSDIKEIEEEFISIRKQLNSEANNDQMIEAIQKHLVPAIKVRLRKLDRKLMILMHRYNMIFPKIEVAGLDALKQRYGLKLGGK